MQQYAENKYHDDAFNRTIVELKYSGNTVGAVRDVF